MSNLSSAFDGSDGMGGKNLRPKLKIGVIFGGRSGEHEVSLQSARSVIDALDKEKYDVVLIGISKQGQWVSGDLYPALSSGQPLDGYPATLLPEPASGSLIRIAGGDSSSGIRRVAKLDVLIPVLHGTYGEDGTVQGLLELAAVPYVGAGVVGSAVGMDKEIFKRVMVAHEIPVLPWELVLASEAAANMDGVISRIELNLAYPLFVKPANLGSSVGISRCTDRAELSAGIEAAADYDRRIVVEQGIDGRELEVAVLGNEFPEASVIGEVRPKRDFYDYVAKYISDDSELIIPAVVSDEQSDLIRSLAVKAFQAIDCAGLGRVDFLMDRSSSELFINEINSMPGFTRISMYPKLWAATGLEYSKLLDRLIDLALERYSQKSGLRTSFSPKTEAGEGN